MERYFDYLRPKSQINSFIITITLELIFLSLFLSIAGNLPNGAMKFFSAAITTCWLAVVISQIQAEVGLLD